MSYLEEIFIDFLKIDKLKEYFEINLEDFKKKDLILKQLLNQLSTKEIEKYKEEILKMVNFEFLLTTTLTTKEIEKITEIIGE